MFLNLFLSTLTNSKVLQHPFFHTDTCPSQTLCVSANTKLLITKWKRCMENFPPDTINIIDKRNNSYKAMQ